MQRDLSPRAEGGRGARSARSTTSSPARARQRRPPRTCSPIRSGGCSYAASWRRSAGARRLGPVPGLRRDARGDARGARVRARRARGARAATWESSTHVSRRARPARRCGTATASGATRADRVARDLDAWDGRPSTPTDSRISPRAQWALDRGARRHAPTSRCHSRTSRALAFTALERTAATLSHARRRADRGASAASHRFARPALAHLERKLFVDERLPQRRSKVPCASSRRRARVGCSSSSATRFSACCGMALRP